MPAEAELRAATESLAAAYPRLLTPALIIDLDAVEHNLRAMIERVGRPSRWRPHLKTAKQSVIIRALLAHEVRCFKVATLPELELLLETAEGLGAQVDAVVAYPLVGPALAVALEVASRHPGHRVRILVDSPEHLGWVEEAWREEPEPLEVLLDVDLGMGRTGSPPAIWAGYLAEAPRSSVLRISGLHGYDGHLGWGERETAFAGYDALCELAGRAAEAEDLDLVTSGTHSYAHALAHEGLAGGPWRSQVSPGTVLLSDLRSRPAAADLGLRQAAYVVSRVVSRRPDGLTLDAGSKAITPDGEPPVCAVVGYDRLVPRRASEEHLPCGHAAGARRPALGELCWLIPDHVCTTVNLHREAIWMRGSEVVGRGPVEASGRITGLTESRRRGSDGQPLSVNNIPRLHT